ncbi:hypothetical protein ACFWOJ_00280 [Streptomyces sp. NPDC058439]|uniref:hypothetical protein n=1 Tax=Streptomyces sp. NPDC058439 TaxID=3346500 RepID=UPI00365E84E3
MHWIRRTASPADRPTQGSPARAALLPEGGTAGPKEFGVGDVLLDTAPPGDVNDVFRSKRRSWDVSALQPRTRSMDQATL